MRQSPQSDVPPFTSSGERGRRTTVADPNELDPLLPTGNIGPAGIDNHSRNAFRHRGSLSRRHNASRSPPVGEQDQSSDSPMVREETHNWNGTSQPQQDQLSVLPSLPSQTSIPPLLAAKTLHSSTDTSYDGHTETSRTSRSQRSSHQSSHGQGPYRDLPNSRSRRLYPSDQVHQHALSDRQQYYNNRANRLLQQSTNSPDRPSALSPSNGFPQPLLEVPDEIFAVRMAALTVLEPLTYAWVSIWSQCYQFCGNAVGSELTDGRMKECVLYSL